MQVKIPKKHYKVLLVQLMVRFVETLMLTFIGRHSFRYHLAEDVLIALKKLERELKKDVTLQESAINKKRMFDCLYSGKIPEWFENTLMEALREENIKLTQREEQRKKQQEIQAFFYDEDLVDEPVPMTAVDPEKRLEDAEKGDVWFHSKDNDFQTCCGSLGSWGVRVGDELPVGAWCWKSNFTKFWHNAKPLYCGNILKGTFRDPRKAENG